MDTILIEKRKRATRRDNYHVSNIIPYSQYIREVFIPTPYSPTLFTRQCTVSLKTIFTSSINLSRPSTVLTSATTPMTFFKPLACHSATHVSRSIEFLAHSKTFAPNSAISSTIAFPCEVMTM